MGCKNSYLTDVHATTIPWTESPLFEKLLEHEQLPPDLEKMVRSFSNDGYLIIDPEVSESALDGAISDLAGTFQGRIQDAWQQSHHVKTIATAPKVLEVLSLLYRRLPIPFQTLNFNVGTEQATHSDAIHFHCIPERFMCGVWVALEDIDEYNGPLHYYPGSHKLPVIEMHHVGITGSAEKKEPYDHYPHYLEFLKALIEAQNLKKVDVTLKKGQALIWSANLMHGGSPILDRSRSRHSQVTHYYFEGCLYYTPLLSDMPIGKSFAREVWNISTNELAQQSYNGMSIKNPGKWPPEFIDKPQTKPRRWANLIFSKAG